jgi:hypothetical protein
MATDGLGASVEVHVELDGTAARAIRVHDRSHWSLELTWVVSARSRRARLTPGLRQFYAYERSGHHFERRRPRRVERKTRSPKVFHARRVSFGAARL